MCRACLSWTSCVAASRWLAGEKNVQGGADDFCRCYWPDGLKGNALVLTRRRRVPESVKKKGKKKRCSGFGHRTPADSLDARGRRLSVFIFSDESKTHTWIYVCPRESVRCVRLMISGTQQAEVRPHDHPISGDSDGSFGSSLFGWFAVIKTFWGKGTLLACLCQYSVFWTVTCPATQIIKR